MTIFSEKITQMISLVTEACDFDTLVLIQEGSCLPLNFINAYTDIKARFPLIFDNICTYVCK